MKIRILILTLIFVFVFCNVCYAKSDELLYSGYTLLDFFNLIDDFNCNLYKITSGYNNLYVACGQFNYGPNAYPMRISIERTKFENGQIIIGFRGDTAYYYVYDGYNVYKGKSGSGYVTGPYDFDYSSLNDVELYQYSFKDESFFLSGVLKEGLTIAEMAEAGQVVEMMAGIVKMMFPAGFGILSLAALLLLLTVFWRRYLRRLI